MMNTRGRILEISALEEMIKTVVDTVWESLLIG
jgi:hypothetical protein